MEEANTQNEMQKLQKAAIVWFRNDLRIHDHEPLKRAIDSSKGNVVPVYCFDPRQYQKTYYFGFPRSGPLRCRFTIESLQNLRTSLRELGSDLIVTVGTPESVLPQIAQTLQSNNLQVSGVYAHKDIFDEEIKQEKNVAKQLPLDLSWGALTMYHIDDLPFKINKKDPLAYYTQFRQQIETNDIKVRNLVPMPQPGSLGNFKENFAKFLDVGEIPTVNQLLALGNNEKFFDSPIYKERSDIPKVEGGEKVGIERLNYYIWKQQLIKTYKDTRNGLLGSDYASRFSIWLANGCLSPRYIYHQIKKFESVRGANDSTYWLWFELLWRDYFKWIAVKHGNDLFHLGGIKEKYDDSMEWRTDKDLFLKWAHGKTGYPFVDANMKELNSTGFMSNRGRQNVASFLTKDLKLDWRMGAEYFESVLLDFDVSSNYGNWEYVAGVGNDPRQGRYFNVVKQAYDYDEKAEFESFWIPELKRLPNVDMKHRPFLMSTEEQLKYNFNVEKDYCLPLVDVKYARDKRDSGRNQIKITKFFKGKQSQQIKA